MDVSMGLSMVVDTMRTRMRENRDIVIVVVDGEDGGLVGHERDDMEFFFDLLSIVVQRSDMLDESRFGRAGGLRGRVNGIHLDDNRQPKRLSESI